MIPLVLASLVACGGSDPAWAVHHLTVQPSANGLTGTQVWEFFDSSWGRSHDSGAYLCAIAQDVVGAVVAPPEGCADCVVAYEIVATPLDSDCSEALAANPTYSESITVLGIGSVSADLAPLDRYPDTSMGWYTSLDAGATLADYGFAYDAALDYDGTLGAPGWSDGGTYTLWPAFAWDLGS